MKLLEELRKCKNLNQIKAVLDHASDEDIQDFLSQEVSFEYSEYYAQYQPRKITREIKRNLVYKNSLDYFFSVDDRPNIITREQCDSISGTILLYVLRKAKLPQITKALEQVKKRGKKSKLSNIDAAAIYYSIITKPNPDADKEIETEKEQCITALLALNLQDNFSKLMDNLGHGKLQSNLDKHRGINIPRAIELLKNTTDTNIAKLLLAELYRRGTHNAGKADPESAAYLLQQAIINSNPLLSEFCLARMEDLLAIKDIDDDVTLTMQWMLATTGVQFLESLKLSDITYDQFLKVKEYIENLEKNLPDQLDPNQSNKLAGMYYCMGHILYMKRGTDRYDSVSLFEVAGKYGSYHAWLKLATAYMKGWYDKDKPFIDKASAIKCCKKAFAIHGYESKQAVIKWLDEFSKSLPKEKIQHFYKKYEHLQELQKRMEEQWKNDAVLDARYKKACNSLNRKPSRAANLFTSKHRRYQNVQKIFEDLAYQGHQLSIVKYIELIAQQTLNVDHFYPIMFGKEINQLLLTLIERDKGKFLSAKPTIVNTLKQILQQEVNEKSAEHLDNSIIKFFIIFLDDNVQAENEEITELNIPCVQCSEAIKQWQQELIKSADWVSKNVNAIKIVTNNKENSENIIEVLPPPSPSAPVIFIQEGDEFLEEDTTTTSSNNQVYQRPPIDDGWVVLPRQQAAPCQTSPRSAHFNQPPSYAAATQRAQPSLYPVLDVDPETTTTSSQSDGSHISTLN